MLTRITFRRTVFLSALAAGIACAGGLFAEEVKAGGNITIIVNSGGGPSPKMAKPAPADVPRELAMRPLPAYRIEPPDIIQIEMLKLVPKPPYRAEVFDVLQIRVTNTLEDQPIDNYFMLESDGTIGLGPAYGRVRVVGMTVDEIEQAIGRKLHDVLHDPKVWVQLARVSGAEPVTGQYLVGPDGTVNLRAYGTVQVMGQTVAEATATLQKQLAKRLDAPELSVEVVAYNSKVYYVITQGAGQGDNVRRLPITGNETVLDAIANVNGLSQLSSKRIWIARPSPSHSDEGTVLPVDWDAITQRGATKTNYQVMPGDRIFIAEDPTIAFTNELAKKTAPWERMLGLTGLAESVLRGLLPIGVP
jgi:polysaccharide export outer membrane protein